MDKSYQPSETSGAGPLAYIDWHVDPRPGAAVEKTGAGKVMKKRDLPDLGAIHEMTVPPSWGGFQGRASSGSMYTFKPLSTRALQLASAEVMIGSYQHPENKDKKDAEVFHQLLSAPVTAPKLLYSDTRPDTDKATQDLFKVLSSALGTNTIGDNQIVSPAKNADSRRPSFHVDSARLENVNGKTVLAVDGWFTQQDQAGRIKLAADNTPEKRRYSGIFIDADGSGAKVQELFFSADDKDSYLSNKSVFRSAIKSIKWNR
jgi:hypothetical protein